MDGLPCSPACLIHEAPRRNPVAPMHEFDIPSDWPRYLEEILVRARALGRGAVLAFDLDSTVFDNRPRQARIVREFGAAHGVPELAKCRGEFFDAGWDMKAALRNCGLSPSEIDRVFPNAKAFWAERFFTTSYCLDD